MSITIELGCVSCSLSRAANLFVSASFFDMGTWPINFKTRIFRL